jgi:hypothetical protein
MTLFSERYGYVKPSNVIIREKIPADLCIALCNRYYEFIANSARIAPYIRKNIHQEMERHLWLFFFNLLIIDFENEMNSARYFTDPNVRWYKKLDFIEETVNFLYDNRDVNNVSLERVINSYVDGINSDFKRFHFAYRIIGRLVVEISSEEEIKTIETAMENCRDNIKMHLSKALELYAKRPEPDAQNSIKESISAVEAYCREITGAKSLGTALNNLSKKGVVIPKVLKSAFEMLYGYTNDAKSGIRHALMDADGKYVPSAEEAYFMLVTCSAFVNYLRGKGGK